jgi:glycerol-3-phosphate dehydrogenase (NAD(P)+)
MKIAYLGAGTWGFALASLLANNGFSVTLWARRKELIEILQKKGEHPKLPGFTAPMELHYTHDIDQALQDADVIIESVTSAGIRPICEIIQQKQKHHLPFIVTSKGIEQKTGLLLSEVAEEVLGEKAKVGVLSGPSHAEEVIKKLPSSVVCSARDSEFCKLICNLFTAPHFRVYPNLDMKGVSFGGAMKNIIAIACGLSDGMGLGDNAKAALMTRGLHEMRKLVSAKGGKDITLNGLSGLGDLCATCFSKHSRNYRFGRLIAEGYTPEEARESINMAIEGAYTCVSALELGQKNQIPLPITEVTNAIIYKNMRPKDAVDKLLRRDIKEEHL